MTGYLSHVQIHVSNSMLIKIMYVKDTSERLVELAHTI